MLYFECTDILPILRHVGGVCTLSEVASLAVSVRPRLSAWRLGVCHESGSQRRSLGLWRSRWGVRRISEATAQKSAHQVYGGLVGVGPGAGLSLLAGDGRQRSGYKFVLLREIWFPVFFLDWLVTMTAWFGLSFSDDLDRILGKL